MLTLVFDLDGTLVDTAPDLIDTLNTILGQEGLPPIDFDTARTMIGGGSKRMLERGLAKDGRTYSAGDIDRLYGAFITHYAAHITDRSRPYPDLEDTLQQIGAAGYRLAVCTNKLEWLSVRLLERLNLARYFAAICGQDTFGVAKPDPEVLRRTILRAGGEPARAIMIGNSITDVLTARAAALPVIAVDYGYSDVPVATLRPDRVIGSPADLPAAVAALSAG